MIFAAGESNESPNSDRRDSSDDRGWRRRLPVVTACPFGDPSWSPARGWSSDLGTRWPEAWTVRHLPVQRREPGRDVCIMEIGAGFRHRSAPIPAPCTACARKMRRHRPRIAVTRDSHHTSPRAGCEAVSCRSPGPRLGRVTRWNESPMVTIRIHDTRILNPDIIKGTTHPCPKWQCRQRNSLCSEPGCRLELSLGG